MLTASRRTYGPVLNYTPPELVGLNFQKPKVEWKRIVRLTFTVHSCSFVAKCFYHTCRSFRASASLPQLPARSTPRCAQPRSRSRWRGPPEHPAEHRQSTRLLSRDEPVPVAEPCGSHCEPNLSGCERFRQTTQIQKSDSSPAHSNFFQPIRARLPVTRTHGTRLRIKRSSSRFTPGHLRPRRSGQMLS